LVHEWRANRLVFVQQGKVINAIGVSAPDAWEGVKPAHLALGDRHLPASQEVQNLARGAYARLDVTVGRCDYNSERLDVLHRHEEDRGEIIIYTAVVDQQDRLFCHGSFLSVRMGPGQEARSAPDCDERWNNEEWQSPI